MKTKLGITAPGVINCIHNTFRVSLNNNMSNTALFHCVCKASITAKDFPSTIERLTSIQLVPTLIKRPIWSRKHHPELVLFASLWKPASRLHLYQSWRGFCQVTCCCCCSIRCPLFYWLLTINQSSHNCLNSIKVCSPWRLITIW
jgi:hypothetical protein